MTLPGVVRKGASRLFSSSLDLSQVDGADVLLVAQIERRTYQGRNGPRLTGSDGGGSGHPPGEIAEEA